MNFGFTEEQELLRAEVRKLLDESCPLEQVRKITETHASRLLARALAAHRGARLARAHDSRGVRRRGARLGGPRGACSRRPGAALFPSPLVSTALARARDPPLAAAAAAARALAAAPRRRLGDRHRRRCSRTSGAPGARRRARSRAAPAGDGFALTGEKLFVGDAARGGPLRGRVPQGRGAEALGLAVVERGAAGVSAKDLPGIDLTKRIGRAAPRRRARSARDALLGAPGDAGRDRAPPRRRRARRHGRGGRRRRGRARASPSATRSSASSSTRRSARFQGVKHPLAESVRRHRVVAVAGLLRGLGLDDGPPGRAARRLARQGLRERGASRASASTRSSSTAASATPGSTTPSSILKRAKWMRPAFGDADFHYERVAALGGL